MWEAALGSAVLCLAATAATLWAGCEDGALHSFTRVAGEVVAEVARDSTSPVTCLLALQGGLVVGRGDGTATLLPHSGTRCRRTQHWSGARVDRWNSAVVESLIVAMVEW